MAPAYGVVVCGACGRQFAFGMLQFPMAQCDREMHCCLGVAVW